MPVSVTTASRLHFGLLRFEQPAGRSYGGLGMMITEPRWRLELSAADRWSGEGAAAAPAMEVARRVLERIDAARKPPALQVRVLEPIPAHRGLGGGTQLGLAVAAGVRRLLDQPSGGAEELAQLAGRGRRSAVGAHGFIHGGLLWEAGRLAGQPLGELAERVAVPSGWRVVLVDAGNSGGLSGDREVDAFSRLPPVPAATTARLADLAANVIVPAVRAGDFAAFSSALYDYGRTAGECFAPVQGGGYASTAIARCVEAIRELGVAAVGQSSWGPTVFAITESPEQAADLQRALTARDPDASVSVTTPCNGGAIIETL